MPDTEISALTFSVQYTLLSHGGVQNALLSHGSVSILVILPNLMGSISGDAPA